MVLSGLDLVDLCLYGRRRVFSGRVSSQHLDLEDEAVCGCVQMAKNRVLVLSVGAPVQVHQSRRPCRPYWQTGVGFFSASEDGNLAECR